MLFNKVSLLQVSLRALSVLYVRQKMTKIDPWQGKELTGERMQEEESAGRSSLTKTTAQEINASRLTETIKAGNESERCKGFHGGQTVHLHDGEGVQTNGKDGAT